MKETRNNKVRIIDDCNAIIRMANVLRDRAYRCPELDDVAHAQIVEEFAEIVNSAMAKVEEAVMFDYN